MNEGVIDNNSSNMSEDKHPQGKPLDLTSEVSESSMSQLTQANDDGNNSNIHHGLSEYEITRARNIERNNARLHQLGLISSLEQKRSNNSAWGRKDVSGATTSKKRKSKVQAPNVPRHEATRTSKRLKGLTAEVPSELSFQTIENDDDDDNDESRMAQVEECRAARLRAALAVEQAGAEQTGKENRTTTYDHCLMRVCTMTPKKLATRVRIRVIERAAGRHCLVKMAIFKSCLQDEGMWDLAEQAREALERLKTLQPAPDE
eukprot:scaffold138355_cov47-Attheya_sp.AAC.2